MKVINEINMLSVRNQLILSKFYASIFCRDLCRERFVDKNDCLKYKDWSS